MGAAAAARSPGQDAGLLQLLQLAAGAGGGQAGQRGMITGCITVVVSEPVAGDHLRDVESGPDSGGPAHASQT